MRPVYQKGSLLDARDLNDEQDDRVRLVRHHSRFAHGSGRVCGLLVYAAPGPLHPWQVGVCPGYAVTPCGDEIEVPERTLVDIRDFAWSRPAAGVARRLALVALRFASVAEEDEGEADCGCGCGCSHAAEGSGERLRDSFAIDILWHFDFVSTPRLDLCHPGAVPCPPPGVYVLLAAVRLPVLESTALENIDVIQL
jgi:hypothetical protein